MTDLRNAKTFDELLDMKYGEKGTAKRDQFESNSRAFMIGEMQKEARKGSQDILGKIGALGE